MIIVLIPECLMSLQYLLHQDFEDRNYIRLSFLSLYQSIYLYLDENSLFLSC